ncbi:MAG: altronate dehydratase [Candidatus Lokiarchaeota archaeon]|nr:altronate dehydratase [Candidatus Lokiarchaeota archaeon]
MKEEFLGYERSKGKVGIRNKIAVISSVVCVNQITQQIANKVDDAVAITHPLGCGQFGPDYNNTLRTLVGLGSNPNIYGVIVVGLGCENLKSRVLAKNIQRSKKPVEFFDVQDLKGGSIAAIKHGIKLGNQMREEANTLKRESFDFSNLVLGLECGGSDSISGISANPTVGLISDRVVELGGTSILPEFTEWIGTEHLLVKRAINKDVADKIYATIYGFIEHLKRLGIDFLGVQPTPGNIEGGLSTIEEKSLGNIAKSGKSPIQGILEYSEAPKSNGLHLMNEPGLDIESMTGLAAAGAQVILMTTGRGSPCGNPVAPVIKLCGNPKTCEWMGNNIDIDASVIIKGEKSIEELAEVLWVKIKSIMNGQKTQAEKLGFNDIAIWRNTTYPFHYMHRK